MNITRIVAVGYRNTSCQVLIELHRNMLTNQNKILLAGVIVIVNVNVMDYYLAQGSLFL